MQGKNRDLDASIQFFIEFRKYCETVDAQAKQLMAVAQSAEPVLRDEVGREAINRVYEFCHHVIRIVYQGEARILVLEKRYRQIRDELEEIRGRSR